MGLSVFPAPSTGPSIPEGLKPPTITYSNNWSLTGVTGIGAFTNTTGNVLTYRKTDNSLYFAGFGQDNLYKFDLNTNTGSRVNTSMSSGNRPDLFTAQDGTIYLGTEMGGGNASVYRRSTDGGVTFSTIGNSSTTNQGFITVIDNGSFPGISDNIIFTTRCSSGVGERSVVVVGTTSAGLNQFRQEGDNSMFSGFCLFPVRDGEDSPSTPNKLGIVQPNTSTAVFSSATNSNNNQMNYGYAALSRYRESNNNVFTVNAGFHNYVLNTYNRPNSHIMSGGRPTSIQNRWLVSSHHVTSGSPTGGLLYIHDYDNNFARVGTVTLRHDSAAGSNVPLYAAMFSNPVYVSATKKLYVFYAHYVSGVGDARMYEYNVTTY